MNRLRRDLIERRLWIVVVALVAAVVAVPLVLHGHSNASADIVAPPTTGAGGVPAVAGAGSSSAQATSDRTAGRPGVPAAVRRAETTRDPFLAATSSSSSTTSTGTTASPGSTTDPPPSTDPASATTAVSAGGASETSPPAGSTASGATNSAPTSVETTTVTVTTTTPTTTAATTPTPAGDGPWTVYAVNAAVGATDHVTTRTSLARLTPLPSVRSPKVMFTGVLDHGHEAMFALGDGVQATGTGRCEPSRANCAAIALAPGQVETLSWFASDGSTVTRYLADHITPITVDSQAAAQTAFARVSQAGQCELELADPVAYDATRGTVSQSTKADCQGVHHAVPFPGSPNGA